MARRKKKLNMNRIILVLLLAGILIVVASSFTGSPTYYSISDSTYSDDKIELKLNSFEYGEVIEVGRQEAELHGYARNRKDTFLRCDLMFHLYDSHGVFVETFSKEIEFEARDERDFVMDVELYSGESSNDFEIFCD